MITLKLSTTPRWPQWLLVGALHLLVLLGLQLQRNRPLEPHAVEPPPLHLRWLPATPKVAPAPATDASQRSPARAPAVVHELPTAQQQSVPTLRLLPSPATVEPAPTPPTLPGTAAQPEPSPGRLMDSAATQRAIRAAARQGLNQERFEANGGNSPSTSGSERLARQVARNAKGDCTKGEFAGAGLGLLSLPFYLAAEASGQCARGVAPQAVSSEPAPLNDAQRAAHASMR